MIDTSPELGDEERDALLGAFGAPAPRDFAERVVDAWSPEHDARVSLRGPRGRTSVVRPGVAALAALAAAALLAWWVGGVVTKGLETRAQQARLVEAPGDPPAELSRLRTRAHTLLAEHCSPCHDAEDARARGEALAVFDTRSPQWWLTMSEQQLEVMLSRAADEETMTPAEVDGVARYVAAELAFRRSGV